MMGQKHNNDFLDLIKFVCCLMILAIHARISSPVVVGGIDVAQSFFRMAVPLFFLMSSYFFFSKYVNLDYIEKRNALTRFIFRNGFLYLFWGGFWMPVTLAYRYDRLFSDGIVKGILMFMGNVLTGDAFFASWFLHALILSVVLVVWATGRISDRLLLIVALILNGFAVFCSSYSLLLTKLYPSLEQCMLYRAIRLISPTSFVSGLIWIVLGKFVAEKKLQLPPRINYVLIFISYVFLLLEMIFVRRYIGGHGSNNCYFMLVPCVLLIFLAGIKTLHFKLHMAKRLRSMSIVFYVTHGSIFCIIDFVCGIGYDEKYRLLKWIIGVGLCSVIYFLMNALSSVKRCLWLKRLM